MPKGPADRGALSGGQSRGGGSASVVRKAAAARKAADSHGASAKRDGRAAKAYSQPVTAKPPKSRYGSKASQIKGR